MEASLFDQFWSAYPADLCNRKGSRQEARKKWDKIPVETQSQILINMREMMRVDRKVKKSGANMAQWVWPMVTTWLNQARWEDIYDIKQSADLPIDVSKCDCGNNANIKGQCWDCYDKAKKEKGYNGEYDLRSIFIKNGLLHDESKKERTKRCKEFLRSKGYLGSVIPDRS